jgi:phosphatidylethanolamine/phosphatidyl-N-methylethanolamine N-methyltransferase
MSSDSTPAHEIKAFARAWLRAPLKVGAIVPSGPVLARAITAEISAATGPVLELGPGTGVFTHALLARGVAAENLTLLEFDPKLATILSKRFPNVRIVSACATQLPNLGLYEGHSIGAIVSGLPFLSMPQATVQSILEGAFSQLRKGGAIYQFTYRPLCPVPRKVMKALNLTSVCTNFAIRNLPPAWVFSIQKCHE